jgi:succinate dehydrogenase/fumarate reductase-like Fe-S protein
VTVEPAVLQPRHRCANHKDRPAHAVCMSCRKDVCGECATEWDGINYCVSCLAARRKSERRRSPVVGAVIVTAAALLGKLL